jgi:hypothetical protein
MELLRLIVDLSDTETRVEQLDMYMKGYTAVVTRNPATGVWESTFGKNATCVVALSLTTPCRIVSDASHTQFEIRNDKHADVIGNFIRNESTVCGIGPLADTGVDGQFTVIFSLEESSGRVVWDISMSPITALSLEPQGFEKAHSIIGPFSLTYIVNYLDLSRFRVFSSSTVARDGTSVGSYTTRDFSVHLIAFLEYIGKLRKRKDEVLISAEKRLEFKTDISSRIVPVKAESDKVSDEAIIRRIFCTSIWRSTYCTLHAVRHRLFIHSTCMNYN